MRVHYHGSWLTWLGLACWLLLLGCPYYYEGEEVTITMNGQAGTIMYEGQSYPATEPLRLVVPAGQLVRFSWTVAVDQHWRYLNYYLYGKVAPTVQLEYSSAGLCIGGSASFIKDNWVVEFTIRVAEYSHSQLLARADGAALAWVCNDRLTGSDDWRALADDVRLALYDNMDGWQSGLRWPSPAGQANPRAWLADGRLLIQPTEGWIVLSSDGQAGLAGPQDPAFKLVSSDGRYFAGPALAWTDLNTLYQLTAPNRNLIHLLAVDAERVAGWLDGPSGGLMDLFVWNVTSGNARLVGRLAIGTLRSAAFLPDGSLVLLQQRSYQPDRLWLVPVDGLAAVGLDLAEETGLRLFGRYGKVYLETCQLVAGIPLGRLHQLTVGVNGLECQLLFGRDWASGIEPLGEADYVFLDNPYRDISRQYRQIWIQTADQRDAYQVVFE
jgi:hypothetical protein